MSKRIGVLGSICNPPHLGHATLARSAAERQPSLANSAGAKPPVIAVAANDYR